MKLTHHLMTRIIALALLALGAGSAAAQPLGFTPPRQLHPSTSGGGAQVASDGAGNWVAVWRLGGIPTSIMASRSNDNGATWALPVTVANFVTSSSEYLDLTTDGLGIWVVVLDEGNYTRFSRSTDNGATWTPPANLGLGLIPCVATDGLGHWVAIWGEIPNRHMVSRSTDGCVTWTTPAVLTTLGGGPLRVTTDGLGNWVHVWHATPGPPTGSDQDIFISRSTDNGVTWSPAAALNSDATTDTGTDIFPQVATDGAGNWVAVWGSGDFGDIMVARSTNGGATWTPPAVLGGGGGGNKPSVATDGLGNWLAAWYDSAGPSPVIMVSLSTDNGASWTPPGILGAGSRPSVATDGLGHWVIVCVEHGIWVSTSTGLGVTAVPGWEVWR